MKNTPKTKAKNTPVSSLKSTRILTGSVAALLTIAAVGTAAQAATLVRLDLGGNGFPDAGFVEYKASSTYADRIAVDTDRDGVGTIGYTESHNAGGAWFGSTGSNIWDHRDISGSGSNLFSGLLDTATGSATGISLTINNANRSNDGGNEGDWRGSQLGVSRISAGGLNAASSAGMNWTITGLLANTATELWIYANDKNYEGTAYTVTGETTVSLIDPARYTGNWTKRDESSIYNGYGWGMTVTTDSFGTLTGWAKENSEIRGLQIYQPSANVTWLGPVDGNWSSAPTWSTGAVPTNSTSAVIDTASLVTVDGTHAAASLALSNQGKLEVSTGNSLAVSGPITVAAVSAGSAVTMGHNTTLSAQSGAIASLSAGGNVTINATGAGQTITMPTYTASASSVLTKGGVGTLALTNAALSTDPLGASTTGIVLNGGTLSLDNSTTATTNNALKANLYYNPYSPNPQLRFEQAGSILSQTPFQTASDTGLGNANGAGINYNGNNSPSSNNFNALFPGMTDFDNFQVAWTGFLTAPASGSYNLYSYWADNAYSVYVDLNQDGVFTLNEERWEANTGSGSNGSFNLTSGQKYKVAFGFAEQGGDQNVGFYIDTPGAGNFNVNPSNGSQAGWWSYDTTTYGALNMAGKSLTVTASSTLQLGTDQAVTFGALNANGGTAAITGAVPSVSFTSTTVPGAITSGIAPASAVTVALGPVSIGAGGTLVVGGQATATSTSLTASGGVQVSSGGTYNVGTYTDGAVTRTFTTGGAGTTVLNNSGGAIVAADTTFRVEGGILDATNSGSNDPLGGSNSIQLAGGTLKLQGATSVVNGLTASLYYTPNRESIRFHNSGSLFTMAAVQTVIDTGLGNSNGVGINYNGDAAWQVLFPAKAQNDNFSVLWTGYLNAPSSGTFNLNSYWGDDAYSVYVDLNQDNVFTANEMRSESGLGGGQGSFSLTGGQAYKVALGFREDGGGDNVGYKIYGPGAYNDTNVDPSHANQAGMWTSVSYGALNFGTKDIEVLANSGLNAVSDVSATFGELAFTNGVLTVSGNPLTTFSVTSVAAAATQVGFISGGTINTGAVFGNDFTGTFVKGGSGNLTLNTANSGLANATFDVQAGRLTALSAAGLGGSSNVQLSGGQLFLSSNGGDQAYNIGMDVTQNSTLTVGKDATSGVNAPVTVTLGSAAKTLTVRNGKTLTVNATDSYALALNNSLSFEDNSTLTISGSDVNVNILGATTLSMNNGSSINLNAGTMHTNHAISVYNLNLNGGVLSLEGAGVDKSLNVNGTLTVNNGATNLDLTGGALLTTAGGATINLQNGTITTDSALNVGNLTVEAGGTLNRTGALAADRNVSVGSNLRLVNKSFSTVGSALSVGNRIELVNSTLAFDNSLSLNTVNMDNYSVFSPSAGTTTTLSGNIEMYNHSSANFTGSTLAMTNRLDVRGYSTLTIANPLTLNSDLEFQDHAIVDFGTNVLTTNQDRQLRINDGSELRVPSSSNLNISYLEIQGGTLTAGSVNISDRIYFSGRDSRTNNNVHSFNITQASSNRYIDVNGDSIRRNPADGSSDTYLTGTNTFTGNTNIGNAAVLVASEGVGLPALSTVRFRDGVLGTSGTFTREIGANDQAGQVYWDNQGGFAAYGGNLTVSLKPNGGAVDGQLQYGSSNAGFNGQRLYLGSTNATHDVTITNPIEINSNADIQTWSRSRMATLSGNLTGTGEINKNEGPGTLALAGSNSGYTGTLHIRRGAVDVGLNGAGLGSSQQVWLRADTSDWMNWYGAVLQGQGTLTKEISDNNTGGVFWDQDGGGFAARGGALNVVLDGGGTLNWGEGQTGFNGRSLTFGSTTSDNVVTLANNINAQNDYRRVVVMDNPNSANDKAVLGGNLTNLRGFEKRGTGTLETHGNAGLLSTDGEQVRIYNSGTLKVLGDLRAGNAYSGGDPRHFGASENNIEIREGGKLVVTGNAQANYFYMEDNGTSSDTQSATISGNLNIKDRIELNNGSVTIGGNVTTGENYNIRNKSNLVINGNVQVGAPNGNSADRDVYVENGGDLTFNGNVLTNRLQATGKNSNGRASTIHVNGIAIVGNTGSSNMHFNADNPTTGGGLDGSGTVSFNFANFENGARLGGALTLNVKDRIVFEGNNGILAPGNGAGTLTVNGSLTLNGGSSYYFDAGDMVNVNAFASSSTGSQLIANDGWNLNFQTGGSTFAAGGSIQLFQYANLGSFDTTPNYNVSALIAAGWLPGSFDTSTLSLTASGGVVTLFGLQRQPITWTGDSAGPGNDLWSTGSNWATAVSVGNVLTFAGINRTAPVNDFTANSSFAGLQFDASAGAFTITGNALDLTGDITSASANTQTLNVAINLANTVKVNTGTGDLVIGGNLSGGGGLTKQGAGTLTLGGVNAQTGTTRIEAGVLAVANDGNLGAAGATLQFAGGTLAPTAGLTTNRPVEVSTGGGTLNTNGFDSTLSGAYSGTGSLTKDGVGTLSLTGTSTNTAAMNVNEGTLRGNTDSLKGNVVLANVSNLAFDQSTDGTYTKSVSGEGQLTKEGDGVLTVQGTHTYIGDTVISGGTLKLAVNPGFRYYRFQVTSNVNSDLSQQSEIGFFSSGTNPSNGTRVFATSVIGDGGDNGDGGWAALNDNDLNTKATYNGLPGLRYVTFDFGTAFAATGYDWATANDSTPDRNPNNWTVSASNDNSTYTLIDTQIGQGTNPTNTFTWAAGWALSLGGGGAGTNKLPVGTTVRMASGTTLNLNNVDQQVAALADASGSPTGHVVQLAGATLAIGDGGSAETTFNGDIIGSGTDAVVKNGTSVQNLNGAQQYDHLTVSGGTLNVNGEIGTDPANGTASVTVTGAGTSLKFGSVSQTLSTLTIGDGATLTFGSGAASGAFSGGGFKGASIGGGSVVPEPGTIGLLLVGAIGVLNRRRRQG